MIYEVIAVLSLAMFIGSLLLVRWLVLRIPPDYFAHEEPPRSAWADRHPVLRAAAVVARNVFGHALIAAGVMMLVLPGQGLLTMLVGLILADYPGKRRLVLRLAAQPNVRRALDWIRRRGGQPLLWPGGTGGGGGGGGGSGGGGGGGTGSSGGGGGGGGGGSSGGGGGGGGGSSGGGGGGGSSGGGSSGGGGGGGGGGGVSSGGGSSGN